MNQPVSVSHVDRCLPRVPRARRDCRKKQRPAGNRLAMPALLGKRHEDAPPVVKQRDEPHRQAAAPATGRGLSLRAKPKGTARCASTRAHRQGKRRRRARDASAQVIQSAGLVIETRTGQPCSVLAKRQEPIQLQKARQKRKQELFCSLKDKRKGSSNSSSAIDKSAARPCAILRQP
jgi:hypothetical protein